MKRKLNLLLILVLCISMLSCSSGDEKNMKSDTSLTDTKWVLKVLNDKIISPADTSKAPYIIFSKKESRLNGKGGCNTIFSSYALVGDKLTFGPIASTEMYCDQMETETEFLKTLSRIVRYRINGTILNLYNSEKIAAKLEAVK